MFRIDERTGAIVLAVGLVIAIVGLVWLLIRLMPVLRTIVVRGFKPGLVIVLGTAIAASPILINKFAPPDDKAKTEVKTVEGSEAEERLTLTGAKPSEYEILNAKKTFAVLQWANADVTDELVERLRDMPNLRELDLDGTAITDKSLALIATLPKLRSLRLAGTKITDDGFRQHIVPLTAIMELDLTGTAVKGQTGRDWKVAVPDRKLTKYKEAAT